MDKEPIDAEFSEEREPTVEGQVERALALLNQYPPISLPRKLLRSIVMEPSVSFENETAIKDLEELRGLMRQIIIRRSYTGAALEKEGKKPTKEQALEITKNSYSLKDLNDPRPRSIADISAHRRESTYVELRLDQFSREAFNAADEYAQHRMHPDYILSPAARAAKALMSVFRRRKK